MSANTDTQQRIATLIELRVPGVKTPFRFQNWCLEDYIFCNNAYSFIDFVGGISTSRQIDFSNSGLQMTIGNRSARVDGLRPVRELLKQNNGLAQARMTITELWPDDLTAPPVVERLQVMSSSLLGARADITLKSPAEAVNCVIPSTFLTQRVTPELPQAVSGRI